LGNPLTIFSLIGDIGEKLNRNHKTFINDIFQAVRYVVQHIEGQELEGRVLMG
jgi:hypothetical protein